MDSFIENGMTHEDDYSDKDGVIALLEAWQTHIATEHSEDDPVGCLPIETCLRGIASRYRAEPRCARHPAVDDYAR